MADADASVVRKALLSVWQLVIAPLLVAAIMGLGFWLWQQSVNNAIQDEQIKSLHGANVRAEAKFDRMDDKIDRILERLGVQ